MISIVNLTILFLNNILVYEQKLFQRWKRNVACSIFMAKPETVSVSLFTATSYMQVICTEPYTETYTEPYTEPYREPYLIVLGLRSHRRK